MSLKQLLQRVLGRSAATSDRQRSAIEPSLAQTPADNFMFVLRESAGADVKSLDLTPMAPPLPPAIQSDEQASSEQDNPEVAEGSLAWYHLIADMHLRFVYDTGGTLEDIALNEFVAYDLSVEQAIEIAMTNIRHTFGEPNYRPWSQGVQIVQGDSADMDSCYFLDTAFWRELDAAYPEGMVVAVPKRGGLLFAPETDHAAVELLEQNVGYLHSTSGKMRVSAALYSRTNGTWLVRQRAPHE